MDMGALPWQHSGSASAMVLPASATSVQSLSVPSLCGTRVKLVVSATNRSLLSSLLPLPLPLPLPSPSFLFLPLPLSVSLIECGAVHTAFYEKLEGGPGGALERVDAQTRHLFAHYLRSYEQAVSEAQDPEEVTEVGANGVSGRSLWVERGDAPPGVPCRHRLLLLL